MATRKQSRFTYKLGFRFTLSRPASESERPRQQRTTLSAHRTQDQDSCRNGRELSAIQIQRLVRGWQARVWAVQVVHDRAWRALVLIQVHTVCVSVPPRWNMVTPAADKHVQEPWPLLFEIQSMTVKLGFRNSFDEGIAKHDLQVLVRIFVVESTDHHIYATPPCLPSQRSSRAIETKAVNLLAMASLFQDLNPFTPG